MRISLPLVASITLATALTGCSKSSTETPDMQAPTATTESNILLAEWTGPYGGVPAFDKMDIKHVKEAMEKGIALHLAELDKIANSPDAANFDNTILAMEKAGQVLDRVNPYWGLWSSNLSTPEFRTIESELAPKIAEYHSKISQNQKLFARIKAVYESEEYKNMRADQQRLVWLIYDSFASEGAELTGDAKKRYAEIDRRLAELYTDFSNNLLADEEGFVTYLDEKELGGLPESVKASAKGAAEERGQPEKWAIINTRSSMDPFLTYSDNRKLREKVWRNYYSRGNNGDEHDNNAVIREILKLRDERVALLGYDNFAQWRIQNRMAKTPERAMELLEDVWPAAIARVKEEVADMQTVADAMDANIKIAPWDYRYYAEKVRKEKYELNSDEVKQYLQLDRLREAMFYVAGEVFNFKFSPVPEGTVPVFHPDVKVWEVTDRDSGMLVGLWYLDPFARTGKQSGAWATSYRGHDTVNGNKTVLSANNSNFTKGAAGRPALISLDDAETLFHEFGHALHSLSSSVDYPTLNGSVRDYIEFHSQLLERWLTTDRVINNYLVHYKTGKPMPADLIKKIKKSATFNEGFKTTEYLASALMDLKYHTTDPDTIDPQTFERETLLALGMPDELPMRHRSTQFSHIFSGESYAAGYYGYMWAEVLTSDAAEAFAESPGGFYDKNMAKNMVDHLFSVRNAVDPANAYREFRGHDAGIDALMRDRGFPIPKK